MRKILFIVIVIFVSSCNSKIDDAPHEINFDRDICYVCKMGLVDQRYTAQLVNKYGEAIWFDDIGCLVRLMKDEEWAEINKDPVKMYVGECESGKWLDAEKSFYRYGDATPMGFGYGALDQANDSTFTFTEAVTRIQEGKSLREEFMKKMKEKKKGMHSQ
ncbi:MAG: hypothetical protein B6244_03610 [Candidatus Cloacimonetes bacterium 4572_55]|nr:MAG: hypothetical protein B6244_03610 [Candidatus Cloacimonetes bacterium 4572_55]